MAQAHTDKQASTQTNTPTWADRVTPVFAEVAGFLRSRKQTLTISADITGEVWDTTDKPVTYKREAVVEGARVALTHMVGRKDTDGMTPPAEMGDRNMAKWLDATSTHSGKSKRICLKAMSSVRFTAKRAYKQARLDNAVSAGTQWFADGVFVKDTDTPRPFVSRRKAVSAYLRSTVGDNWSTMPNKGELKDGALAHVRQGSVEAPTAQETKQAQAQSRTPPTKGGAPSPVSTQARVRVSKADLVKEAVALGMDEKVAKGKRKADLAPIISALKALQ